MDNSLEPFAASPYVKGSDTHLTELAQPTKPIASQGLVQQTSSGAVTSSLLVSVEQQMYGTGKPRRVITRGQIVHDRK